jgi:hypothetical protein
MDVSAQVDRTRISADQALEELIFRYEIDAPPGQAAQYALPGGYDALVRMADEWAETGEPPTMPEPMWTITRDEAEYLRVVAGMSDEEINDRYHVR